MQTAHLKVLQHAHSVMKANVYLDESGEVPSVIKDYSKSPTWIRKSLCRYLLNREVKTLKALAGIDGIPDFLGYEGDAAYRMQYVAGEAPRTQILGASTTLLSQLSDTVEKMHRAGITHNDLRPHNLILSTESKLYIIDFGAAFFRPISHSWFTKPGHWFFNYLMNTDRSKVARLKQEFLPEELTDRDKQLIEKTQLARKTTQLWKKYVLPIISPGKHRKPN